MTKAERPSEPRRALGKGLAALLPPKAGGAAPAPPAGAGEAVEQIAVARIRPNPYQPRRIFTPDRMEELIRSIKANGFIQPIVVRHEGDHYILVVGERRWRAARMAGIEKIPALVREIAPDRLLEVTLIENIQREDLNAIETAMAFERMSQELGLVHDEIARRTGKERTTVTNFLRLLELPEDIQQLVAERRLSAGHARAILGLGDEETQRRVAEKAVAQGLSVRQVERMVNRMTIQRLQGKAEETDPNVTAAIEAMEQALGTRVRIVEKSDDSGRIEIEYYSGKDLQRIYSCIVKEGNREQ